MDEEARIETCELSDADLDAVSGGQNGDPVLFGSPLAAAINPDY